MSFEEELNKRRKKLSRRQRQVRAAVIVTTALTGTGLLFVGAFAAGTAGVITSNLAAGTVARPQGEASAPAPSEWEGAINLMVLGSDGREGQTTNDYGQDVEGERADTIQLLHVSSDHTNATVVAIPRDTMVSLPSQCEDHSSPQRANKVMINSTLMYGPYCTLNAVRDLTGLTIDHFVVLGFDSVVEATNAVGGVDICLETDVDDPHSGLNLAAGKHTIQGEQALSFLRVRHGIGDGSDLSRIHTQQTYIAALLRKIKSSETLANPLAMLKIAESISSSIRVDETLGDPGALASLATEIMTIDSSKVTLVQLPVENWIENRNRVIPLEEQTRKLFDALKSDRPIELAKSSTDNVQTGKDIKESAKGEEVAVVDGSGQTANVVTCAGG